VAEVLEESPRFFLIHWGEEMPLLYTDAWLKADCVIHPTETWRDVTGECEVQPNGEIWHKHKNGCVTNATYYSVFSDPAGYRLRKVQVMQPEGAVVKADGMFGTQCLVTDAFIVEKREP
jgi:hypothetical protein